MKKKYALVLGSLALGLAGWVYYLKRLRYGK